MKGRRGTWPAVLVFILAIAGISAAQLTQSYREALEAGYIRSDLSGYLVSEWIAESFSNVELVLRESLAVFEGSSVRSDAWTPAEKRRINGALVRRKEMHGHMVFLGVFDSDCVIRFGSIAAIIGDSSADLNRRYCTAVSEEPVDQLKLSEFFVSATGAMDVSATYPMFSTTGEITGFALAGLDLSFFQRWLDEIDDPTIAITIMDLDRVLLARRPGSSDIGRQIDDVMLESFITAGSSHQSFRRVSPVDGVDRIWTLRTMGDLPFVVAAGYDVADVLGPWYGKLATSIVAVILLSGASIALGRAYDKNRLRAHDMEVLAMNDQLTGLMNRRSFEEYARARIARAHLHDAGAAFIMMDVDHFKRINDTFGHQTGDRVLRDVSLSIRGSFRASDLICRWGGEEYLAYLPGADLENALRLAERLRESVERADFGLDGSVTISAGVTLLRDDDRLEDVIRRADERLYQAKNSGRNTVCH